MATGEKILDVIKTVMEDETLSPVEKVLFAILYCRREADHCRLTVREIMRRVGVELGIIRQSLHHLEQAGFLDLKEDCEIIDATSLLSCTILRHSRRSGEAQTPRP
jgi:DNA-binding MarR family transcriptional regulator